ncbi:MAG: CCA tRNA nucleotidyltransferase [Thermodesulfobacteriota bacterium]
MTTLEQDWLRHYPSRLRAALGEVVAASGAPWYVAGGAVRDWLLGNAARDLDFTVPAGAVSLARRLAKGLGGAFVLLDAEEEAARVVWQGYTLDLASFREGSRTIEEDLTRRDFTINALAVAMAPAEGALAPPYALIDPSGGVADLAARLIRHPAAAAFRRDPLRLLRAYRFQATLGFALAPETARQIEAEREFIRRSAPERIAYELDRILAAAAGAAPVLEGMAASGLLFEVLPELRPGVGMAQPSSHHLDVFGHGLRAVACLAEICAEPGRFFRDPSPLVAYLADARRRLHLAWAALLHDVGKPVRFALRDGRITFYNHDHAGREISDQVALRLRFSRERRERVGRLIGHHMWPFHLSNARRKNPLTPRACLRLIRAIGDDLPGLFLLAMADSLAGEGPGKPADTEAALADLYNEVLVVYEARVRPVLSGPPLLTGHDLQALFGLAPGPRLGILLRGLEGARVAGTVRNRDEAVAWVRRELAILGGEK